MSDVDRLEEYLDRTQNLANQYKSGTITEKEHRECSVVVLNDYVVRYIEETRV